MIIDGRAIAQKIIKELKAIPPPEKWIWFFLMDGDEGGERFLSRVKKTAVKLGVEVKVFRFSQNSACTRSIAWNIMNHSGSKECGGALIAWPLPAAAACPTCCSPIPLDSKKILAALPKEKDIGALLPESPFPAPASATIKTILKEIRFSLHGKTIALVGRGKLIGGPILKECLKRYIGKSLWMLNSKNFNVLRPKLKECDLVITGVGKQPNLITADDIKPEATIIDFGGDVDFDACKEKADWITPSMSGTGPILVAHIFKNFYLASQPRQ